ncbi:MAG: hypothetical protein ABIQ95_04890 [Bdellovibrionia bacterium]
MENIAPKNPVPAALAKSEPRSPVSAMDEVSEQCLKQMIEQEKVLAKRLPDVKFIVLVLSARGMVFDLDALRQKILLSYPDAAVFFQNTMGKPIGLEPPNKIDLLIDFTGPGQRQNWLLARKLRRMARVAVGRNAGLFRRKIYDRVFDETVDSAGVPQEMLQRERFVQKKVLNLAGIAVFQTGETPPDRGKTIALELPGMSRR